MSKQQSSSAQQVAAKSAPSQSHLADHQWAIEKLLAKISIIPATASRWLNRAAENSSHSFLGGILGLAVKFFSSIWLGLLWLLLTGIYIAIGSGFANIRANFEMTDMQFFNAWPMVTLMILLLIGITVVTLRRIPLTVFKLGSWLVHIGIVTLIVGCFIYFGNKHEGSVRIFLGQSVNHYYDATERALYIQGPQHDAPLMLTLPELPIYHEHLAELGNGLNIQRRIADVYQPDNKQTIRARDVDLLRNMTMRITGYYPYAVMQEKWEGSQQPDVQTDAAHSGAKTPELQEKSPLNPAIQVALSVDTFSRSEWLIAKSPAQRVLDTSNAPLGIEFLHEPNATTLADIRQPVDGPLGITVRSAKYKIEKNFAVKEGQIIKLEGTPYTLTIGDISSLPLVSKGYEGANSSALMIKVERADGSKPAEFNRMVLFRYPELSPDFITENGKQKRIQARVDHDIEITFQNATKDQFWFVQDAAGSFLLINRAAGGKVSQSPIKPGQGAEISIGGRGLKLSLIQATPYAAKVARPILIPERQRPRAGTVMERVSNSVIEVELTNDKWSRRVYVPFVQFASMQGPPLGAEPTKVNVPGVGDIQLVLSTTQRDLPSGVKLVNFEAVKYPGAARTFADYRSTLEATTPNNTKPRTLVTQLNAPAEDAGLYYFQAAWDGDENAQPKDRFTVIGVGNRPGIYVMVAGSLLMAVGVMFAFYIKPILLRMKKKQLAEN